MSFSYAGFWRRLGAAAIDGIVFGIPLAFALYALHTFGFFSGELSEAGELVLAPATLAALFENLTPAVITIALWALLGATPGKFLLECRVVSARTRKRPGWLQSTVRYVCYFVSLLPLGLGFLWIAWDKRKQGWHDKMAGTLVVIEDLAEESAEEFERFVAN